MIIYSVDYGGRHGEMAGGGNPLVAKQPRIDSFL
jgi:hypothetical protein